MAKAETVDQPETEIAETEQTALAEVPADDTSYQLGKELVHLQKELQPHGLTVTDLLRTVAKNFHGLNIPTYVEEE